MLGVVGCGLCFGCVSRWAYSCLFYVGFDLYGCG